MKSELIRTFGATFGAVFLAELGDKTQLATMALSASAEGRGRWLVFVAAASALVATTAIGVLAGSVVTRYVRPQTVERLAGALFIVLGALMLIRSR
jgi:Ca2+/H+ antiporter, TMEM165/GDT1 family